MKKIVFVLLIIINIVMLTGCFPRNTEYLSSGIFEFAFVESHIKVNDTEYVIESSTLHIESIDKSAYDEKNGMNVVKSINPDKNGNYYFSINLNIKIVDFEQMNLNLVYQNKNSGYRDSYLFNLMYQNSDVSLEFFVGVRVFSNAIWIKNVWPTCNINNQQCKNCDMFLYFER